MKIAMRGYQSEEDYWRIREFLRQVMLLNGRRELSWHVSRLDYWWWFINPHLEKIPLALFARDAGGTIVAGLTGSTYWEYLYVGRLWTDERFRKLGLGSRLLAEAEKAARRRGCHAVHLMTGSFNALPFYQKRGYTVFGALPDMPTGHTQYFMTKSLV